MEEIKIQYLIKRETKHGLYQDALYFSQAEWDALTDEALEAHIQARVNNWVSFMDSPPPPPEPTQEQLEADRRILEEQLAELNKRLGNM